MASAVALMNELFMIISSVFVGIGWYQIRSRKNQQNHRKMMITATVFGALFFISYALSSLLIGDSTFGGPQSIALFYQVFLQVHVILATLAAILGVITLVLALKGRFQRHKKIAPWTAIMWFISAGTGLVVYLMLFIIYKPGPTVGNILHLILKGSGH